jgi:hypothetical protein
MRERARVAVESMDLRALPLLADYYNESVTPEQRMPLRAYFDSRRWLRRPTRLERSDELRFLFVCLRHLDARVRQAAIERLSSKGVHVAQPMPVAERERSEWARRIEEETVPHR